VTRHLGLNQIDHLRANGAYGRFLIVPNKVTHSLVRRGLMEFCAEDRDSFAHITPSGLRALADEIEAGRIPSARECLEKMKKTNPPEGKP
jgi:hypothetical protein